MLELDGDCELNWYKFEHRYEIMNMSRCAKCSLSKDASTAELVHTRIGLDEAPEPLVCKCRPDSEVINGIMNKLPSINAFLDVRSRMTTMKFPSPNVNAAIITKMSRVPNVEVELRMSPFVSQLMYDSMLDGVFGDAYADVIAETGCSWWSGPSTNKVAKLRTRTTGDTIAKMIMCVHEIMPGIKLAVSYEYVFTGEIVRPEYISNMNELTVSTMISDVNVKMISRKYMCEDVVSYSSEIELEPGVAHAQLRLVLIAMMNTIGSEKEMKRYIDSAYMDEVRHADHDVVDVKDLTPYKGTIMIKADGMKVYVFCYVNGYVVTFANASLTVINYTVGMKNRLMYQITNRPDVLVAELMANGDLVYIDTLALSGMVVPCSREYRNRPMTAFECPGMIVRRRWNKISNMPTNPISRLQNDGIVCVSGFRTLRLKEPTIDLLFSNGLLYMSDNGKRVAVSHGHGLMSNNSVYEFTVIRSDQPNLVKIINPVKRLIKKSPNNSDIIRRAFMSVSEDANVSMILYDITSMSFAMRSRTYQMAQTIASAGRKVIVTFGVGRFQEMNEMRLNNFSYIAIDPDLDISNLKKRMKRTRIVPYDVNSSASKQIAAITNSPGTVLYYKGTSESFIMLVGVISTLSTMSIPSVFSFSISYHIAVINTLVDSGASVFGCGFIHDDMPTIGVGTKPVTMNVIRNRSGNSIVKATFGKSTYVEPILTMNSVLSLHLIKSAIPEIWQNVDSSTYDIMSRAVIMC